MNIGKLTLLVLLLTTTATAWAQKPRYGIKAGLNVPTFLTENEKDANGNALDSYTPTTGFQVGIIATLPLSEVVGLDAELLFTQRGGNYLYKGKGYYDFQNNNGASHTLTTGDLRMSLKATNGYIELPIMFYVKPISKVKINLGVAPSILIDSKGAGEFYMRNRSFLAGGSAVEPIRDSMAIGINADYIKDGFVEPDIVNFGGQVTTINGDKYISPRNVNGYYFNGQKNNGDNMFNLFDVGATAGVSYFFNSGLSAQLRGTYGLLDATSNSYDRKWSEIGTDYKPILTPKIVRNFNVALTIGFTF